MKLGRWSLLLAVGPWLVLLCRGEDATDPTAPARPAPVARRAVDAKFRGAGSCASTSCHGGVTPMDPLISPRVRRNEHTTWLGDDAHARAYEVLFDERSEAIVARLAGGTPGYSPAHRDARCLACHATPRPVATMADTAWLDADGVGCEACHGAASRWLGPHTTDGWAALSPSWKSEEWGMTDLQDLSVRARTCAGCHVGEYSSDGTVRDVNHDLIGAGHPRLNFELSASLDNMPPHWDERGANAGPSGPNGRAADLPARAWAVGRVATLLAALDLLEARASRAPSGDDRKEGRPGMPEPLPSTPARPSTPWPEFTEYGCFSCHHDLRDQTWRRGRKPAGFAPGAPIWGAWTLPASRELIESSLPPDAASSSVRALDALSREMAATVPNAKAVATKAHAAAGALEPALRVLSGRRLDAGQVRRLIDAIDRPEAWDRISGWDEAAQRYLALVPLRQAWVALEPGRAAELDALGARLEDVRRKLEFPTGLDSPRLFDPGTLATPSSR